MAESVTVKRFLANAATRTKQLEKDIRRGQDAGVEPTDQALLQPVLDLGPAEDRAGFSRDPLQAIVGPELHRFAADMARQEDALRAIGAYSEPNPHQPNRVMQYMNAFSEMGTAHAIDVILGDLKARVENNAAFLKYPTSAAARRALLNVGKETVAELGVDGLSDAELRDVGTAVLKYEATITRRLTQMRERGASVQQIIDAVAADLASSKSTLET